MTAGTRTVTSSDPRVPASLLLPTQLVFNLGFYAVVPFLALVMADDLGLGAAAIGLVLGARTFSQQGMFLFGGALADHWGPRRSILTGCVIRGTGYVGLALSDSLWPFLLSAVLTGVGGAFFSPAVESLVGTLDRERSERAAGPHDRLGEADAVTEEADGRPRRTLFAWLVLVGEIGAVLGPLVGLALLPFGFPLVASAAAGLFLAVGMVLWLVLPVSRAVTAHDDAPVASELDGGHPFACLRDRRFVIFAALFSVNLLAYNQLYFALPLDLTQDDGGVRTIALLFTVASVLTIALQLPVSAVAAKLGPAVAFRAGFGCIAAGAASMVLLGGARTWPAIGPSATTGAVTLVVLLTLGHMLVGPVGLQQVHGFAGARRLGAYYGLLASCGGVAVLVGNPLIGLLRESFGSAAGWSLPLLLAVTAAVLLPRFLPVTSTDEALPLPTRQASS